MESSGIIIAATLQEMATAPTFTHVYLHDVACSVRAGVVEAESAVEVSCTVSPEMVFGTPRAG
jgi:hypothetical protein